MNKLPKSGPRGLPIATPSTCWHRRPLKIIMQFFTVSDRRGMVDLWILERPYSITMREPGSSAVGYSSF